MKKKALVIALWFMLLAAIGVFVVLVWHQGKNSKKGSSSSEEGIVSLAGNTEGPISENPTDTEQPETEEPTTEKTKEILEAEAKYPLADPWQYDVLVPTESENTVKLTDAETVMAEAKVKREKDMAELEAKGELTSETEIPEVTIYNSLELTPLPTASHPAGEGEDLIINQTVTSTNLVLIDADTGEIIVEREPDTIIYPASMIKILTVLVAVDYIQDWDDTYVIKAELLDYAYANECSCVGFLRGETVTVRDLFYGTIVCSGADACLGLADYCCGSEQEFVRRMNLKLKELGIKDTMQITNCIGIHEETQYCTVKDMAVIMNAAVQNPFVRDALSQMYYAVPPDDMVPEGIQIANAFMCRIENEIPGGAVVGAKTGYSPQIGFNAASYYETDDGRRYICVTVNCDSTWRSIYDHIALYRCFT